MGFDDTVPSDNTIFIPHRSKASSPISWSNAAERAGPCARPLQTPSWLGFVVNGFFCWTFGKEWIERCLLCTVFWKHIDGTCDIVPFFNAHSLCKSVGWADGAKSRKGKHEMSMIGIGINKNTCLAPTYIYIYIYHIASSNQYQTTICNHWTNRLEKLNIHPESWIGCLVVLIE